jgi:ABC-type cobalamin/Fe3+-siderophores transport system ATPase subunit
MAQVNREIGITTRYFPNYEALEDAFRLRIATLLPRKHAGTDRFWQDFQRLLHAPPEGRAQRAEHYITSNPRDCLAFGTPRQVLKAALMTAAPSTASRSLDVDAMAARFGLLTHLNQPVHSLSGGETVRLALAKAFVTAARADRLTLASPFSWLSLNNRRFFNELARHCRDLDTPMEVFALEGEDSMTAAAPLPDAPGGPMVRIFFHKAGVVLSSLLDGLQNRRLRAAFADVDLKLRSPCLVRGDNGQGKSLLAKVLAGAASREGTVGLETEGQRGRVRLLLQDLVNQTMMRTFRQSADGTHAEADLTTHGLYDAIRDDMLASNVLDGDEICSFADRWASGKPASLLELKVLLAAVRLVGKPAAIILDEPDWGLRQASALVLVSGIIRVAHRYGVAVWLISHKPWWRNRAGSFLQIHKTSPRAEDAAEDLFRIQIKRMTVP